MFCDTELLWKVWAKSECCFPNQVPKIWSICFEPVNRLEISHIISLFCLKGKLPEAKLFIGILVSDTKGLLKVWVKTECCFPNQSPKYCQFVLSRRIGSKFEILLVCFVWKVSCLKRSFSQDFYFVILKGRGMFGPKLNAAFQISPPKVVEFVLSRQIGPNFKFYWFLLWER